MELSGTKIQPHGFWRRRVGDPIIWLLTHGVTAEKVTQTLAVGTVCSMFPFIGTTTMLNAGVGLWLRMNQPILQTLNYLLTPLHVVMILVYVRMGEWIWRAGEDRFTVGDVVQAFHEKSIGAFLQQFSAAGLHALTAWAVTAPLLFAIVYYPARPVLRRMARRNRASALPLDSDGQSGI